MRGEHEGERFRPSTSTAAGVHSGIRQPPSKPQVGSWRYIVVGVGTQGAVGEKEREAAWIEVRRRKGSHSRGAHLSPPSRPAALKTTREVPRWLQGRCFKCLGLGHQKAHCTGQIRCFRCWYTGHLASSCAEKGERSEREEGEVRGAPKESVQGRAQVEGRRPPARRQEPRRAVPQARRQEETSTAEPGASRRPKSDQASASVKEMAGFQICTARPHEYMEEFWTGEPELRPAIGDYVLSWTAGMERNEAWLNQHTLMASVLKTRPSVSSGELLVAIVQQAGVREENLRVDVTHTEDFLLSFRTLRDRNSVFRRSHEIYVQEVPVSFKLWSRRSWADSSDLKFFTKISLDGLPAHLWERETVRNRGSWWRLSRLQMLDVWVFSLGSRTRTSFRSCFRSKCQRRLGQEVLGGKVLRAQLLLALLGHGQRFSMTLSFTSKRSSIPLPCTLRLRTVTKM